MAFRTNYRFQRTERDRTKQAKKEEKAKKRQERTRRRSDRMRRSVRTSTGDWRSDASALVHWLIQKVQGAG